MSNDIPHKSTVFVRVRAKLDPMEPILKDLVVDSKLNSSTILEDEKQHPSPKNKDST